MKGCIYSFTFLGTCQVIGMIDDSHSCSTRLTSPCITFIDLLGTKHAPFDCSPLCFNPSIIRGSLSAIYSKY